MQSLKEISQLLGRPSAVAKLWRMQASSNIPVFDLNLAEPPALIQRVSSLVENPEFFPPGEEDKKLSLNLALYGACFTIMNDQMQPVFRLILKETLGAIQNDIKEESKEACFFCVLEIDYFNQRLMSWEPLVEP